jgi:hypothetical protein
MIVKSFVISYIYILLLFSLKTKFPHQKSGFFFNLRLVIINKKIILGRLYTSKAWAKNVNIQSNVRVVPYFGFDKNIPMILNNLTH